MVTGRPTVSITEPPLLFFFFCWSVAVVILVVFSLLLTASSYCISLSLSPAPQLKIVDPETRREVASGEVGEIWLSSPSVAAGYWGLPELTTEAFSARLVGEAEQADGESSGTTG